MQEHLLNLFVYYFLTFRIAATIFQIQSTLHAISELGAETGLHAYFPRCLFVPSFPPFTYTTYDVYATFSRLSSVVMPNGLNSRNGKEGS